MAGTDEQGAVVVVSFGDPTILLDNPLLRDGAGWAVVVVDNFSTDAVRTSVRRLAADHGWELLEPTGNVGFGAGANLGIAHASAAGHDVVLLVNPDAELEPGAAAALAAHVRAHPLTLAAPRIVRPDGSTWFGGASLDLRTGRTSNRAAPPGVPWLSGACLAATADAWLRSGGFDDDYFLYWEDIDLSYRWVRDGGLLTVLPDVVCTHTVGGTQRSPAHGSTPDRAKSAVYYYYNCRNRLLFARRHLPARARRRWAVGAVPYARSVVLRGGRRQLLRPGPTAFAAARGTVAGLRLLLGARRSNAQGNRVNSGGKRGEFARNVSFSASDAIVDLET